MPKLFVTIFLLCINPFSCFLFSGNIFDNEAKTNTPVSRADIWSPFNNAATLAGLDKFEISAFYQNRFAVKELSTKAAQTGLSTHVINIGLAVSSFGYSAYNENIAGLSFARKFSEKLMLGVQFDYYFVHFSKNEGNKGKLLAQLGILSHPIDDFYIGFHVFNPVQTNIKTEYTRKEIPSVFSLGSNYIFSDKALIGIQLDKEIRSKMKFSAEFEYRFLDYMLVKLGCLNYEKLMPTMGLGLKIHTYKLDTDFRFHSVLGITSNIALTYTLK